MNLTLAAVLEILKYILPALVVLLATYTIVSKFIHKETRQKHLELLQDTQNVTIRLRLQAYERLVIYLERIHPRQLVPRLYQQGMTVSELRSVLVYTINTELEHNYSQQIYVTKKVWDTVRHVKEQELNMINNIAQQLDPQAPARDLHTRIVDYILTTDGGMPTEIALQIIQDEARMVLNHGSI